MSVTAYDICKKVYRKYEGDTDYPEFAEDDMQLYFGHLVDAVDEWKDLFPEKREQYAELSDASDGDKVTTPGVKTLIAPTNFIRPATFIYVGTTKYDYVEPQKMELEKYINSQTNWFSIIGYPGAYKIILNPTPAAAVAVSYPYWKTITVPTDEDSVIEVSRPNYCVFYILRQLYLDDESNKDLARFYEGKMDEEVFKAKAELAKTVTGQLNKMGDLGKRLYGASFGQVA